MTLKFLTFASCSSFVLDSDAERALISKETYVFCQSLSRTTL